MLSSFFRDARSWCYGRSPYLRAVLLLFFAYIGVRHILDSRYNSIFFGLNLGIHECGHFAFGLLGEFIGIAGGSIMQCLIPILSIGMFYKQRDFFAIAIAFGWLATNLFYVATYIADARAMALPLVSPFGAECVHDWNYLLGRMGILEWDGTIAFFVRVIAVGCVAVCLASGGWLLKNMLYYEDVEE